MEGSNENNDMKTLLQQMAQLMAHFLQQQQVLSTQYEMMRRESTAHVTPIPVEPVQVAAAGPRLPLPLFHGRDGESVTTWLFQANAAFESVKASDAYRLNAVISMLGGAALQWYHNWTLMVEQGRRQRLVSWKDFESEIRKEFQAPHQQQLLRERLSRTKQIGTVQQYAHQFRSILNQIEEMNEMDMISYFTRGLQTRTRGEVKYRAPTTLKDAIDIAITYDTAWFGRENGSNAVNEKPKQFWTSREAGPTPMELGTIRGQQPNKEVCRKQGLCFYCREQGHRIADCPKKKASGSGKDRG